MVYPQRTPHVFCVLSESAVRVRAFGKLLCSSVCGFTGYGTFNHSLSRPDEDEGETWHFVQRMPS